MTTAKKYFTYDPDEGPEFFATAKEAKAWAEKHIDDSLEPDGWTRDESEMGEVCWGVIVESAQVTEREKRPEQLDADGLDEDGNYWGDWNEKITIKLVGQPAPQPPDSPESEIARLKAELEDTRLTVTELCDYAWEGVYELNKFPWEYPMQAIRHLRMYVDELKTENAALKQAQANVVTHASP